MKKHKNALFGVWASKSQGHTGSAFSEYFIRFALVSNSASECCWDKTSGQVSCIQVCCLIPCSAEEDHQCFLLTIFVSGVRTSCQATYVVKACREPAAGLRAALFLWILLPHPSQYFPVARIQMVSALTCAIQMHFLVTALFWSCSPNISLLWVGSRGFLLAHIKIFWHDKSLRNQPVCRTWAYTGYWEQWAGSSGSSAFWPKVHGYIYSIDNTHINHSFPSLHLGLWTSLVMCPGSNTLRKASTCTE